MTHEHWNAKYQRDAQIIAASVVSEFGQHWAALEMLRPTRKNHLYVAIAMRALMLARNEIPDGFLQDAENQIHAKRLGQ